MKPMTVGEFRAASVAEQIESVLSWAAQPEPDAEARSEFAMGLAVALAWDAADPAPEGAAQE